MPKQPSFFGDWSGWRSGRFGDLPGGAGAFGFGGGFPFGNGSAPAAPRKRAQQWDLRAGILALLAEAPRSGYQIMQDLQERSLGQWRPAANVVYPTLQQLQDEGLVRAEEVSTARVYQLTEAGRSYVDAHRVELDAPWQESDSTPDAELFELFGQIRHIGAALWQIGGSGRAEQIGQARRILTDARRALERVLTEAEQRKDTSDREE
jgi:DNA-binding PadR family transcriptional regulator